MGFQCRVTANNNTVTPLSDIEVGANDEVAEKGILTIVNIDPMVTAWMLQLPFANPFVAPSVNDVVTRGTPMPGLESASGSIQYQFQNPDAPSQPSRIFVATANEGETAEVCGVAG